MSDDHLKLVARIQHFYELMLVQEADIVSAEITKLSPTEFCVEKLWSLHALIDEYERAFESFLYKEIQ